MLTRAGCLERQSRLWDALPESVAWLVVADPRHIQYLVNFCVNPLSFSAGERSLLLIRREGGSTLIADNFTFRSRTATPFIDQEIILPWYDHRHSISSRDGVLTAGWRDAARSLAGKGIAEKRWLPAGCAIDSEKLAAPHEALEDIIHRLRRSKHEDEIALLKRCMQAGAAGQARALQVVQPGATELDVYREVQSASIAAAGEAAVVYGDFRANHAEQPKAGGLPTQYQLKPGDLFLLDFSVVISGYRSDFTNTIAVGTPTDAQVSLYDTCVTALSAGSRALAPGVAARDVYAAASQPFLEAGLEAIPHHAGHGLGLAHPEAPILVPESDDTLVVGDVVTIEPGRYEPGVGGVRVEHNFLITESGAEQLSHHTLRLRGN